MAIKNLRKNFSPIVFVAIFLVSLSLQLLLSIQPSYATSKAANNVDQQYKRTLMEGFKKCVSENLPESIHTDYENKIQELHIFNTDGRGNNISVGHEILPDDGKQVCGDFDGSVQDLGYASNKAFAEDLFIYEEYAGSPSIRLDEDKRGAMLEKIDNFINERQPIFEAEKIRRLRFALETFCADKVAKGPTDNPDLFFTISNNEFKWKDGDRDAANIPMGHDLDYADGQYGCAQIVGELQDMDGYNDEHYKEEIAKEQCAAEGKENDQACIDAKLAAGVTIPDPGSGGANAEKEKPTCEVKLDSPLSWLMCPILNLADRLINRFIEDTIFKRLEFTFDDEGANAQGVWKGFRTLANIVFIIAFLVAIFGQATSFIDAYTIKKMLPRLVIAAIMIQLSFVLCELMVNITNVLGKGVGDLIAAPFGGTGALQVNVGKISGAGQGQLFGIVLAGAIAGFFGAFSLLGLAMAAFFGVIGALITIVFRESILFLLIVVSPVALVLWTLPNVDKYAKMWFSLFAKTLLMYPLIVAFITIGKALGSGKLVTVVENQATLDAAGGGQPTSMLDSLFFAVAHAADTPPKDNGALDAIVAVILYFGPIFLIPFTFKFAGGALATIGGFTGKMGQGMVAGAKKRAQMKGAQRRAMTGANMKSGQLPTWAGGNTAMGKKFGRGVGATMAGPRGWMRGKQGISASMEAGQMKRAALVAETGEMQAIATNDKAQALLARASNAREAKQMMEDYIAADAKKGGDTRATWEQAYASAARVGYGNAGARRQAYDMWTKSGYNFADGEKGYEQLQDAARGIAGGDEHMMGNLMNQGQFNAKNAGLAHLGGINNNTGYEPTAGFAKLSEYQLGQLKPQSIKELSKHYSDAVNRGDGATAENLASVISNIYPNANLGTKEAIRGIVGEQQKQHMVIPKNQSIVLRERQTINENDIQPSGE